MKKQIFGLMALLLCACAGLTACSDDKEEEIPQKKEPTEDPIDKHPYEGYRNIGLWNLYSINDNYVSDTDTYDLEFLDDGTGVRTMRNESSQDFKWDISDTSDGEEMHITYDDNTYSYIIILGFDDTGKYMELHDMDTGDVFLFYAY